MDERIAGEHVENGRDLDEDGFYGAMKGSRHLSGEFDHSEEEEDLYGNDTCAVSGTQTTLQEDRTDVQEIVEKNSNVNRRGYGEAREDEVEICAVKERGHGKPMTGKDDRGTRGRFTEDEALKLAIYLVRQSFKMIQTVDGVWNGVESICRDTYAMIGRSKH